MSDKKVCPSCGKKLVAGKFCPDCGVELIAEDLAQPDEGVWIEEIIERTAQRVIELQEAKQQKPVEVKENVVDSQNGKQENKQSAGTPKKRFLRP